MGWANAGPRTRGAPSPGEAGRGQESQEPAEALRTGPGWPGARGFLGVAGPVPQGKSPFLGSCFFVAAGGLTL